LQSLAGIFGPALFANLFALFISDHAPVKHLPGVAFVLAAALVFAALWVTAYATRHLRGYVPQAASEA
jgi:DHA1 family tetracycline resistance protein-like MFS transporter